MHRHAAPSPQLEPASFGRDPAFAARARSAAARNFRRPSRRRACRKPRSSTDSRASAGWRARRSRRRGRRAPGRRARRAGSRSRMWVTPANAAFRQPVLAVEMQQPPSPLRVVPVTVHSAPSRRTKRRAPYSRGRSTRSVHAPRSAGAATAGAGSASSSEATIASAAMQGQRPAGDRHRRADRQRQAQAEMLAGRAHHHRAQRRPGAEDHPVKRHHPARHAAVDRGLDQRLRADPGDHHRGAGDKHAGQRHHESCRSR